MSKYTVTVWQLAGSGFDFGLDKYPIFDEEYRDTLNEKIIEHYMFYEIGSETPEMFKFRLNRAMNEIMPRFNKFYEAELLKINPLLSFEKLFSSTSDKESEASKNQGSTQNQNVNSVSDSNSSSKTTTNDSENATNENSKTTSIDGSDSTTNVTDSNNLSIESDTPQDEILLGDIEANLFATKANVDKNGVSVTENKNTSENGKVTENTLSNRNVSSEADNTNNINSKNDTSSNATIIMDENTKSKDLENLSSNDSGFDRPQAELLQIFRDSVINIDEMVIEHIKIKNCFMLVF